MKSFKEKENICQSTFGNNGPFWHCYTSGKITGILFVNAEDFKFAMNVIAQASYEFRGKVTIITFEIMDNHFHFILTCEEESYAIEYFEYIKKRLGRSIPDVKNIELSCKRIDSLQTLRNSLVYVNRNGYVVSPDDTPFSYPWGANKYYFNDILISENIGSTKNTELRKIFRGRDPKLPKDWGMLDGIVAPPSFCAIKFGMSLFRDAHHYFNLVSKSVESYSEIATDIDDGEFMTDQELFSEITKILNSSYSVSRFKDLSDAQKLDLARTLRFKYRSSNGQIRRLTGISQYQIDQLFRTGA